MRSAGEAAAQSDRRYEVIINIVEQNYILREVTTPDLSEVLEEEIITMSDFSTRCRVVYVIFDDFESTDEGRAAFRAGHNGWQYGGVIVLADQDDNLYSVVVNRLNRMVTLIEGEVEPLEPITGL